MTGTSTAWGWSFTCSSFEKFKLLLYGDSKPEPLQSFKEIALDLVLIDPLQVVAAKLGVAAAGLQHGVPMIRMLERRPSPHVSSRAVTLSEESDDDLGPYRQEPIAMPDRLSQPLPGEIGQTLWIAFSHDNRLNHEDS